MPSPSGPRSGRHGYMNGMPFVRNWGLNWNRALETRYHSASFNGPERLLGIEDWNGTVEGFGSPHSAALFPASAVTVKLFAGPDDGVYGSTGIVYTGDGIVDSMTLTWTFQPNASLGYSIAFSADSCLTYEENEYYDTTATCEPNVCSILLQYAPICDIETGTGTGTGTSGPPSFTTVNNVETATLTITATNQVVINSSTNCCTQREPGVIEWSLSIVDQEQYPIFDFQTYYAFRLFTKEGNYWDLGYGLLQDISDIRADVETGDIMTKNNMFLGTASICCDDTDGRTTGHVIDPDGVTMWPITS